MTKIIRRRTALAYRNCSRRSRRADAREPQPGAGNLSSRQDSAHRRALRRRRRPPARPHRGRRSFVGSTASSFVIDNKRGAGGNLSAETVARAPPDGMTLLLGTVGTAVTNQYLYRSLSYHSEESFAPVALVGEVANVLAVHPSFPAKTLEEFVAYCKVQGPNNVTYSSPGVGSSGHLAMEYLQILAGIKLAHVVYRGRSAIMKALVAGHIPIAMDNLPPYLQHIQSGALRALGVSSSKRWFAAPDVPTVAEQGYADFDAAHWWYVAAPAGTRLEVVNKLSDEIVKGIKSEPAIKTAMPAPRSGRYCRGSRQAHGG